MPEPEPHYFGSDLEFVGGHTRLEDYLALFRDASPDQIAGEKSVYYLFSERAAAEIEAFCPSARIVIMLREPVEMLWSLHGQRLRDLSEDIADFEEALAAEADRARGERVPDRHPFPRSLQYTEIGRYAPQVRRFFDVFPRDRILVLLFDDLQRDAAAVFARTIAFLGVPAWQPAEFEAVNVSASLRSASFQRALISPPGAVRALARLVLPSRQWREGVVGALTRLNLTSDRRGRVPQRVLRAVGPRFRADVRELEGLISRDLSSWVDRWR